MLLAESERFPRGERRCVADVDTELLRSERLRMGTFDDNRRHHRSLADSFRPVVFRLDPPAGDIGLRRELERFPFVPADPQRLQQDCNEAYNIQVSGLEQRLRALNYPKVVIGVSGGLDSTHALIVAARAMDREGRPRSDILAFTLPGFATGDRTKNNAIKLAKALGVSFEEIDITETARLMLDTIGHPFSSGEKVYDVTFENVQAGCAPTIYSASQTIAAESCSAPATCPNSGWGGRHMVSATRCRTTTSTPASQDIDSAPDALGHLIGSVRRACGRGIAVGAGHRDHSRTGAHRRGRRIAEQRVQGGPLRVAGLLAVSCAAVRISPLEDWLSGLARVERLATWQLATRFPRRQEAVVLTIRDPALADGLRPALLFVQPVQAVGTAQWSQGVPRRCAVSARRLAGSLGHVGASLARRDRNHRAARLASQTGRSGHVC
ncbi:NAD synthase family protein [Mycobacterium ulcerans str. Harvey]|uniref:NAD synthase family protein n=1 Tax=Mycobacterium ulcerans str. Harvey TaxID=1299332 RepID=A0ABN0QS34_MYCUL|nr:NAD synthase family protein [Mycobacterium ulcerans str. Harvey]